MYSKIYIMQHKLQLSHQSKDTNIYYYFEVYYRCALELLLLICFSNHSKQNMILFKKMNKCQSLQLSEQGVMQHTYSVQHFGESRLWMEQPSLRRVSEATMAKSSPATASTVLKTKHSATNKPQVNFSWPLIVD